MIERTTARWEDLARRSLWVAALALAACNPFSGLGGGSGSKKSAPATPTPPPPAAPAAPAPAKPAPRRDPPAGLTADPMHETATHLAWNDRSDDETSFELERAAIVGGEPGAWTPVATLPAGSIVHADRDLVAGGTYRWRVRARGPGWASDWSGEVRATLPGPRPPAGDGPYSIVYVRYPRLGDEVSVDIPDGENPYEIFPGADLVLLAPDGTEQVLVDCGDDASVLDPMVSYDGRWVYYARYVGLVPGKRFYAQAADSFLFKIRLDVPAAERREIQLTDFGDGFEVEASSLLTRFGIRDLAPNPLPDGRVLFCSNRAGVVAPHPDVMGNLTAVEAATASQLHAIDDHDGSEPNRNLEVVGPSSLHHAQHPIVLADGRILFTNWDDAGLRASYGSTTLYTCNPDGSDLRQFLEPHNQHKKVDHFVAELSSGHVVVANYYPFMALWGFGLLHRYPLVLEGPAYSAATQPEARDYRWFSRKGVANMTPHTSADDVSAPHHSGRYSTPAAAPDGAMLLAYSPGPVVRNGLNGSINVPRLDAGIYRIDAAGTSVIDDPSRLVLVKNDPAYNEMYPRPVVPYRRIHGIDRPAVEPPGYGYLEPTPRDRGLARTSPIALGGTSSLQNRESAPLGRDWCNSPHQKLAPSMAWAVQGTDVGRVRPDDLYGVRVVAVVPERYVTPFVASDLERAAGLLWDSRASRHVKGAFTHTEETWKVLGEFPVRDGDAPRGGSPGLPDPSGEEDTSFLARLPADTTFFYQGLDRRGMTLFTEQTWRHAVPGEVQAACGGCHAHSIDAVAFRGKKADAADYRPWDLVGETPLVALDPGGAPRVETRPAGLVGVEFQRDVYPILEANCANCHTSAGDAAPVPVAGVSPKLALFDSLLTGSFERRVRTYRALALDPAGRFAHGTTIPAGQSRYWFPQMSRYVRAIQARSSLLVWKLQGARLDGRTNAEYPLPNAPASEDIDYVAGTCPAPTLLSAVEKRTIARWVDLGAALDLDRPANRYTGDGLPPVLEVEVLAIGGGLEMRVGLLDLESGLDAGSLRIEATLPDGTVHRLGWGDLAHDRDRSLATARLPFGPEAFGPGRPLRLLVEAGDLAGNARRKRRTLDAPDP